MHAIDPDARERALQKLQARKRREARRLVGVGVAVLSVAAALIIGLASWGLILAISEVRL